MARKVFTVRFEFDGDEFYLDGLTGEYVERVLRERVGGKGVSLRVVDESLEGV